MRSFLPLSLFLSLSSPIYAVILPIDIRVGELPSTSLRRRGSTLLPIDNIGNAQYVSNITLGGVSLPVLLDTGSSDLWVTFPKDVPNMQDTGKSVTLSYAVGKASGNVQTIQATMGNMTVENQAFLFVANASTFTSNIHAQGYDGLLGLGTNSGSLIRKKVGKGPGDTFMQRYFEQDRATDNFITFLLDRKRDPTDPFKGQFSVEEVIPGFENITSMPKLDVETVNRILKADQHWQALTDEDNGIIGPDGNPIKMKSIVPKAPKGQYVAVIDTGFTISQVPRDVSDAIYGRVRGAVYDTVNEWWTIPCGQYLNISFNFGGRNYPVHPLDTVDDNFQQLDATGKKVCIGAFQPITSAFSLLGHYDMILGMSFLRNAYTLLDFGNWINNSDDQDHPYIQMASLTNVENARSDFITQRLNGVDTTSDARWALLPADQMQKSPISPDEKKKRYQEMILSRWPYILLGCLLVVIISIGLCVWKCCCNRRKKESMFEKSGGFFSRKPKRTSYFDMALAPKRSKSSVAGSAPKPFAPSNNHFNSSSTANLVPTTSPVYHNEHANQSTTSFSHSIAQHEPMTPNYGPPPIPHYGDVTPYNDSYYHDTSPQYPNAPNPPSPHYPSSPNHGYPQHGYHAA